MIFDETEDVYAEKFMRDFYDKFYKELASMKREMEKPIRDIADTPLVNNEYYNM